MLETLPSDPLFWGAAIVAIFGVVVHYLYSGFIQRNYRKIKWFRRLFLPHITKALRHMDEELDDHDLSRLYVETSVSESEHVLDVEVPNKLEAAMVLGEIEREVFLDNNFRPEVLLASLASNPGGYLEMGNWVKTAPEKKHPSTPFLGKLYEVVLLILAEWQLHIRIYYDEEQNLLRFYVHHEKNAYSPFHAQDHYDGDGIDVKKGRSLFKDYLPEMNEAVLRDYDYEVTYE